MRQSLARLANWGKIDFQRRGIVEYDISKYEVKMFGDWLKERTPNMLRRVSWQLMFMAPGLLYSAVCYNFITTEHHKMCRKNPDDYVNETFDD